MPRRFLRYPSSRSLNSIAKPSRRGTTDQSKTYITASSTRFASNTLSISNCGTKRISHAARTLRARANRRGQAGDRPVQSRRNDRIEHLDELFLAQLEEQGVARRLNRRRSIPKRPAAPSTGCRSCRCGFTTWRKNCQPHRCVGRTPPKGAASADDLRYSEARLIGLIGSVARRHLRWAEATQGLPAAQDVQRPDA